MPRFLTALLISLALVNPAAAKDKDVAEITKVFKDYHRAYSESRFLDANGYIHPRDLEKFRELALPVLIEANRESWNQGNPILEVFFNAIPLEETSEASNLEIRAAYDQAFTAYLPAILDSTDLENIEVLSVEFQGDDSAVVRYELHHNGKEKLMEEKFEKLDERWKMLMVVRPEDHASGLRKIF